MLRIASCTLICLMFSIGTLAWGQSPLATPDYYGRGVHAYFSGNTSQAREYLTLAIGSQPNDPRPYYFRALSSLCLGWRYEAEQDMEIGAALEAESMGTYAVGFALQRVQGGNRLLLERYRRQARAAKPLVKSIPLTEQPFRLPLSQQPDRSLWRPVQVPLESLLDSAAGGDFTQQRNFQEPDWIVRPGEEPPSSDTTPADNMATPAGDNSADPFLDDISEPAMSDESEVVVPDTLESEPTDAVDSFDIDANEEDPFGSF